MSYLTSDHLGSPRIITDEAGQVISRHDYMAFGDEVTTKLGNVGGRLASQGYGELDDVRKQYTGYERDKESGLDYAQARYYNSNHGRFTSVDPLTASASIRNPQTFNRYSYVLNSPYKFTDPLGLISVNTGACGNFCQGSDGGTRGGAFSSASSEQALFDSMQLSAPPETPPIYDYYVERDGYIILKPTDNNYSTFFVQNNECCGFTEVSQLEVNDAGLVKFPDSGNGFDRYGTVDAGGKSSGETVGQGDHYVRPVVAAALFGLATVLKEDHRINISFGDMSSSNGSDPWQKGFKHHPGGHGHNGNRSGLDVDFRYINNDGVSFQSETATTSSQFSVDKNQTVYTTAKKFGFTENYQGTANKLKGVPTAKEHNDHGHLGFNSTSRVSICSPGGGGICN